MERVTFAARSKITIDVCARDGNWFDASKLVACVQYIEAKEARGGRPSEEEIAADLEWQESLRKRAATIEHELYEATRAFSKVRSSP